LAVAFDRPERAEAALPADQGIIAFESATNPQGNTNPEYDREIFTMNPDGSGIRQLTFNSAGDYAPSLTAGGTKVAFVHARAGNYEIYKMNVDGSGRKRLTNNLASDNDPAFSPDGKKIVFVSDRDGNQEIYSMNADGSGTPKNLTNNAADDIQPTVSPDGRKIAFATLRDDAPPLEPYGQGFEIYVMDADGSAQTRLTHNPSGRDWGPDFSADGKRIVFRSGGGDEPHGIYVMAADGSDQPVLILDDIFADSPSYSTDGKKIAFDTATEILMGDGPQYDTFVMNSDGTGRTQLTTDSMNSMAPDWQPNSAPFVEPLRPAPGSAVADRTPRVSAKVSDVQENLAKSDITTLSLDGKELRRVAFAYDSSTDRLSYTPPNALSYGRHTVRLVVRDSASATATKAWSFSIVRR
jgi:Tol biopolymer transport system component